MPFMLGAAPLRRTLRHLEAKSVVFQDAVKVLCVHYNVEVAQDPHETLSSKPWLFPKPEFKQLPWGRERVLKRMPANNPVEAGPQHRGAQEFVFWNLPQIQYANPDIQVVVVKNKCVNPYLTAFLSDGRSVLFDVDSQSNSEIVSRLRRTLGKTEEQLAALALAQEKRDNPANFGRDCDRYCFCAVPGQVPCSSLIPVPKPWREKYYLANATIEEVDEMR